MKSTYKLIGAFWDGLPTSGDTETAEIYDSDILVDTEPENLFDQECFRRSVPLSELFGASQEAEIGAIVARISRCDEVFLVIDCQPRTSGLVPNQLHRKRTLQMLGYLRACLPRARVQLMQGNPKRETA